MDHAETAGLGQTQQRNVTENSKSQRNIESPTNAYSPADHTILDIRSRDGSVDHYFHFLLGFLPPLLLHQQTHQPSRKILIRSCGPFDAHLADLRLRNTIIIPDPELRRLAGSGLYDVDRKFGYDTPKAYDRQIFANLRNAVLARLNIVAPPPHDLLLINRGASPAYYQSDQVAQKGSANLRRTVPNTAAIHAHLLAAGHHATIAELETMPFRDQIGLFLAHRRVIAQHGAALANMVWMAPGAAIIEIRPKTAILPRFAECFRRLAECLGHRYTLVDQNTPHAPVPPVRIIEALQSVA
jgi:hypothetical protein